MAPTVYVLAGSDGETWHYLVPRDHDQGYPTGVRWEADGQPMTHTRDHWYSHPGLAETVVGIRQGYRWHSGWQLNDVDIASEKYPETLTVEEFNERTGGSEYHLLHGLYSAVYDRDEPDRFEYPRLSFVDLGAGEPAPKDGLTWAARLPWELEKHPEVLHLFPGKLTGFRDALKRRLEQIPGVDVYTSSGFEVYAKVSYDPPRHRWVGNQLRSGGRSKTRGRQVQETLIRRQTFRPPTEIEGPNRAAAVEAWHAEMARWVDLITEMATVRACAGCGGTGVVDPTKRGQ